MRDGNLTLAKNCLARAQDILEKLQKTSLTGGSNVNNSNSNSNTNMLVDLERAMGQIAKLLGSQMTSTAIKRRFDVLLSNRMRETGI